MSRPKAIRRNPHSERSGCDAPRVPDALSRSPPVRVSRHGMLIVLTIPGLPAESGGPTRSVTSLSQSLSELKDVAVVLVTQQQEGRRPFAGSRPSAAERYSATWKHRWSEALGLPMRKALREIVTTRPPAVLHDNGIWHPANHHTAAIAKRYRIPLVVHPHGMLLPSALEYRGWKKRAALWLYQRRDLSAAALLFATAPQEAESLRAFGLRQPIAIIPSGVYPLTRQLTGGLWKGSESSPRTVLFLGRVHPIKGLLGLVEAWARVRPMAWRLRIAGPDEGGHLAEVLRRARTLGIRATVEYVGAVEGEAKETLLSETDVLILPSFSENFGVVVAEALAHGIPVVTTTGTPWGELRRRGCGWWVEPTVDALAEALSEATRTEVATLREMGERGRKYASEFDWSAIAAKTADVYRWVLGVGARPDCVVLD